VVLAAGRSERLVGSTRGRSKALAHLGGVPLVERAVRALRDAGAERVVVVVGFQGDDVAAAARLAGGRVDIVRAGEWEAGNGASLAAAEPFVAGEGSFLLVCGDHAFAKEALRALASSGGPAVLVDEAPTRAAWAEGTRVSLRDGHAIAFGKSLPDPSIDCGAFVLDGSVFDACREAAREGDHSLAGAVTRMGSEVPIRAVPLPPGSWWQDIDTPDDLRVARILVRRSLGKRTDGPVSRWINRPLSTRITMALSPARIPPAVFSVLAGIVGLWAAWSLSASRAVVGGLFVQAASVLDGVDGETARLQWRTSERGALVDDLVDRMVDAAIFAGLGLWLWDDPSRLFRTLILAMTVVAWPVVHLAVRRPFQVFEVPHGTRRRPALVVLGSRDVRMLLIAAGSVTNHPWLALVAGCAAYALSVLRRVPFMLARVGRAVRARLRPVGPFAAGFLRRDPPARPPAPHHVRDAPDRDLGEEREEPEHQDGGDGLRAGGSR
jgi:1L-myo-inositol 1-phosphate cytidylyltransferase / CDP-L-myo-inositol myo-inositolphosphotransferase